MKTKACLLISLCLGAAPALPAQTLFNDSLTTDLSNWISPGNQGGGSLAFASSRLNFLVPSPDASVNDTGIVYLGTYVAPSTSSWNAQVDLHLASLAGLAPGQFANLNLQVAKLGDEMNNYASIGLDRYHNGTGVTLDIDSYINVGGSETHLTEVLNSTTDATLLISYDHVTSTLVYAYDDNGPVGGASFVTAHTQSIGGWSMTGGDSFALLLIGGSGNDTGLNPTILSGDGYFQNFSVAAVPEPSTYAVVAGLGALAWTMLRRRRHQQS